jgi:hypothetical protein
MSSEMTSDEEYEFYADPANHDIGVLRSLR